MNINSKLKILYVDDSSVIRDMVESALLEIGFINIDGAEDGIEALELCAQEEYDFIITDINMPNMDGIELITRLRDKLDYLITPIMVLSTEWSKEMKQKGKDAGATSWIVKPFNTKLLRKAITETIAKVDSI
jgi:two-component system, chemotaxis family, chemotaxis protein CheY